MGKREERSREGRDEGGIGNQGRREKGSPWRREVQERKREREKKRWRSNNGR
jgi:hypothetical protein